MPGTRTDDLRDQMVNDGRTDPRKVANAVTDRGEVRRHFHIRRHGHRNAAEHRIVLVLASNVEELCRIDQTNARLDTERRQLVPVRNQGSPGVA